MLRLLALACVLSLWTCAAPTHGAEPRSGNAVELAQQRFREATDAYREGRYSAAASLFEAADRLAPHASTRYNAAAAWDQAGEAARAATGYETALALPTLEPARRQQAEERLRDLSRDLGKVQIKQPLGAFITVDHMQRVPLPTVFYLRPGRYEVVVEFRATQTTTHAEIKAGEELDLELDLPASVRPRAAPTSSPQPTPAAPEPIRPLPTDVGTTQKTLGWIGVGAGVALSGAAIVFGLRALAAKDAYEQSGYTNPDARGEAADLRLATNVLWGGATLAGAAGLVLLLTAPTIEF